MMASTVTLLASTAAIAALATVRPAAAAAVVCASHKTDGTTQEYVALRSPPCPAGLEEVSVAGVNIFDTLWVGSTGMSTGNATYADAKEALESAAQSGVKIFRFFAFLYGTSQTYWLSNPEQFWMEFDRLVNDIERLNMHAIPSLGTEQWHEVANAMYPHINETTNDCVRNTSSAAFSLQTKYFEEVVKRYKSRSSILAWELGNELNLRVNLPPPYCGTLQCFNTSEMAKYTERLVTIIRDIDPVRPISSGFAMPRPSAWHQENCPLTGPCPADPKGGYWGLDSKDQFREMLARQNAAVDLWSVHIYAQTDPKHGCYFSKTSCVRGTDVIAIAAGQAKASDKILYVGEYGGHTPYYTGPTVQDQLYPSQVLDLQVNSSRSSRSIPLTTIWAWACPSHRTDMVCIFMNSSLPKEAGSHRMARLLAAANNNMHSRN